MYLNSSSSSTNYKRKYNKYKVKYQILKNQLGGAKGTLLYGGECASLPYPEENDFTLKNLLDLCPEERITIQNKCYDVNSLYRWIVVQKKNKLPEIEITITPVDKQRLIQAYDTLSPHLKILYPVPSPAPAPVPPAPVEDLHYYSRRFYPNIPINQVTIIDNYGKRNIFELTITANWLEGFDNLKTINLDFNNDVLVMLDADDGRDDLITSNTLETFKLRRKLDTDRNGNTVHLLNSFDVWPRMFVNLNLLRSIDLSFNAITLIYEDSFINLPVLEILNLSNNQISELPNNLFQNLQTLKEIDLSNNQISELPNNLFQNLQTLKEIDLTNNQISIIHNNLFQNLLKLLKLYLGINQITNIYRNTFFNLPVIDIIILSGNRINTIEPRSFVNLNPRVAVVLMNSTLSESNKRNIGYSHM
jgi:Leucine-rich repeat (LRR) protein